MLEDNKITGLCNVKCIVLLDSRGLSLGESQVIFHTFGPSARW